MRKQLALFMIGLGLTRLGQAAVTVYPAAGVALPLENSGGSARSKAMGSAFVGVSDDASAILWNPAGLALLDSPELEIHHNTWLANSYQEIFVLGFPMGWDS